MNWPEISWNDTKQLAVITIPYDLTDHLDEDAIRALVSGLLNDYFADRVKLDVE